MKLGVSNIAWSQQNEDLAFEILNLSGFSGVEVAPTRLAPWSSLTTQKLMEYRSKVEACGLVIPSLQAILYDCPDLHFFSDLSGFNKMSNHLKFVAECANILGAKVVVFGAPKNRLKGQLTDAEAFLIAIERFQIIGDIFSSANVVVGLEPVPLYYGADFCNRVDLLVDLINKCDHPNISLHLDSACIHLGGDNLHDSLFKHAERAVHYQISEPNLNSFIAPICDHDGAALALHNKNYQNWLMIEMREADDENLTNLRHSIEYVSKTYMLD